MVRYLTRCKCVIVELFNSVYCTHTVMSLTQYILLKYANDGRDNGAISNIVLKYLLDCVDKRVVSSLDKRLGRGLGQISK